MSDDDERAKAEFALNEPHHERITQPLDDGRDPSGIPYDQLQIGDPVFYWPEGVDAVVEGYAWYFNPDSRVIGEDGRWQVKKGDPARIVGYKLSCGITVQREHLMRRQTLPSSYKMPSAL